VRQAFRFARAKLVVEGGGAVGVAALLTTIAEAGGNVVHADHVREAVSLHVRETGVEIALETRGAEHGDSIVAALEAAG
jgi:threonine dehydratase